MPFGAHVALTEGRRLKPDSSWKQIQALRRRAFLYTRPFLLHPVGDGGVVAFHRATRGTLAAPSHLAQDPPHMSGVIDDAGLGLDHFGDTRKRPHVGRIAVGERSLAEPAFDAPQVGLVEVRQPPRPPRAAQCADAARAPLAIPPAHALTRHLELARHVRLAAAPLEQLGRLFTPPLHRVEVTWDAGTDRHHDQQQQRAHEKHGDSLPRQPAPVTLLREPL